MRSNEAIEIIPTCVPRAAEDLAECARAIRPFSTAIHIDVTDGLFAPSHTWPYTKHGVFGTFDLAGAHGLVKEIHLMVEEPRTIGIQFARAGALRILGHVEAFPTADDAHGALDAWRRAGAREVGLGILMETPFEVLEHHLLAVDVIHMMSIARIGTQGIPYDTRAPERIAEFHERYPEILISVDGGVSESNIEDLVRAGARRFGVGSALSKAPDPKAAFVKLKTLAESAVL